MSNIGLILIYVLLTSLALFVIVFFLLRKPKKPVKEKIEAPKIKEKKPKSRKTDIMKTLNPREKNVVNFLLENKNHSSQNNIKNNLGIPKTTLIRLFQALEAKNIVSIERIGKMKKITLTSWFTSEDDE